MQVIDHADIVHRTACRTRVRIPGRRNDQAYFGELKRKLSGVADVVAVDVNPLTASVLIEHRGSFSLATFGSVGLGSARQAYSAGGQNHNARQPAFYRAIAKRDEGYELHSALAKFVCAAVTGRLWSHVLEQVIGWCAEALIEALLQPMKAPAQVIQLTQPPRLARHALAAAA
jgi:hypothetical protein